MGRPVKTHLIPPKPSNIPPRTFCGIDLRLVPTGSYVNAQTSIKIDVTRSAQSTDCKICKRSYGALALV